MCSGTSGVRTITSRMRAAAASSSVREGRSTVFVFELVIVVLHLANAWIAPATKSGHDTARADPAPDAAADSRAAADGGVHGPRGRRAGDPRARRGSEPAAPRPAAGGLRGRPAPARVDAG